MKNSDRSKLLIIYNHKLITLLNIGFIQWAPSRDWSRLFILSTIPYKDDSVVLYLEFYNFNNEE
jgi:hypothetical protein